MKKYYDTPECAVVLFLEDTVRTSAENLIKDATDEGWGWSKFGR